MVVEAGKSEVQVLANLLLVGAFFLVYRWPQSHYVLIWWKEVDALVSLLIRALILS